mmetsp:Transcript_22666/g.69233  ORF Transcript_22666/g.69233 Transcript_22666/m.69233 type:complete len:92 (-) Transcript_22666:1764-2039(-)
MSFHSTAIEREFQEDRWLDAPAPLVRQFRNMSSELKLELFPMMGEHMPLKALASLGCLRVGAQFRGRCARAAPLPVTLLSTMMAPASPKLL